MHGKNPVISVIMGIYNCGDTLSEAIECIVNQTFSDWELIMCDDGSNDDTYEIAISYKEKYPEKIIVLQNEKNRGLNYTLNKCLKQAKGKYIARMDGDDRCDKERFAIEINVLEKEPEIAIVSTDMEFFDESGVWGKISHPEYPVPEDFVKESPFCHAPCMVKREAYMKVKGYSVSDKLLRVEDYHLWIKMYKCGYRGKNIHKCLYQMRDDRNAYSRRSFKNRLNEYYVKRLAIRTFRLKKWNYLLALRPIIVGLLPNCVYDKLHKGRLAKKESWKSLDMQKKKILFLIHDLGQGGAEKVLVNLVNNINRNEFDISVTVLFGGGINEQFLKPDIKFKAVWPKMIPGNSKLMKLVSPKQLHKIVVKENYDIEVSYLEGPSARVISGCQNKNTKLISWIHGEQKSLKKVSESFRSKKEAKKCYEKFDQTICVSETVKKDFCKLLNYQRPCCVLYNTVESNKIIEKSKEPVPELESDKFFKLIAVGSLKTIKGYNRLLHIIFRLKQENKKIRLYVLGIGPQEKELKEYVEKKGLKENIIFLGYQTNPYKYVAKSELFVCSSFAEGFSTAATEALIVGTPVCTVNVSGMKEMLGEDNEYGIVTENSEEALYEGIKNIVDDPKKLKHYKRMAQIRGKIFNTQITTEKVEKLFSEL
ncbi:glycosyltransferase [Dorea longicatena]|jgi:glycosyltransferase EpsE|uniref:glycosyltransferase n=1 Tax=Dorea longicatena TaxID=88431 RepID=UPI001FB8E9A4|nr:glycosyltransferase [Dorea longicatena]